MREILFRGKRLDTGEWVEGSLQIVTIDGKTYPIIFGDRFVRVGDEVKAEKHGIVDPNTIGQYTGLKDKNGQRIFEGDIISVPFEEDRSPWEENCVYYENGKVYFCDEHHGWYVDFGDDALSIWEYDGAGVYDDFGVEVIGNIHDNPDLVKEVQP